MARRPYYVAHYDPDSPAIRKSHRQSELTVESVVLLGRLIKDCFAVLGRKALKGNMFYTPTKRLQVLKEVLMEMTDFPACP